GVKIVPVKIETTGDRVFEFGARAEAFKTDLASQVGRSCVEAIAEHGATVEATQRAIAELLDAIALPFNINASQGVQDAQLGDIVARACLPE
ncbi:unnamed protein product, partial [Heterosigma akashiwo]